jgi:CheY-like chemotaxis protein
MILKEFLLEYGVKVDGCLSGTEALQKCDENSYDMIFLDHMMPGMDGIETLNQIKIQSNNKNKNIPIIVVTANAIEGANEYYLEKGFDDYISKPIDTDLLEKILFKYLPEELLKNNNTKK